MRVQDVVAYLESLYPLSEMEVGVQAEIRIAHPSRQVMKYMFHLNQNEETIRRL